MINAVNGIVDSLFASNIIGKSAMSAIGLFGPFNHFLYAASIMFVSGSQILYGKYLARDRQRIHGLFTVTLTASAELYLEEMAGNVVTHGFTDNDRQHSVDIRVLHKDGGIIRVSGTTAGPSTPPNT